MLKIGFNIEGSWDGFLIDFGTVLGAPEGSKMWFSLRRGTNFAIFAYLNISYLLDPSKYRFWVDLGGQVGHQNRTCWLQEGNLWCIKLLLGGFGRATKNASQQNPKKGPAGFTVSARQGGGGPLNQFNQRVNMDHTMP